MQYVRLLLAAYVYVIDVAGRNRPEGVGAVATLSAQVLAGAAGVDGEEGGQDLRHGRRQGAGAGATAAAAGVAGARARAQREQLARTCAQQGRQDVPPLQERRAAHQVKCCVVRNGPSAASRPEGQSPSGVLE